MKYAHYDETDNKLLGWYDDKIHTSIPTPNFEVSDSEWEAAINTNANTVSPVAKTVFYKAPVVPITDLIAAKIQDIKIEAKARIEAIIPQDIQLRTLSRGLLLTKKIVDGLATTEEIAEAQVIEDVETLQLQPIRDASGLIEIEVSELTDPKLVADFDIINNPLWP